MANKKSKIKVLVAMSGGVDSSVAAALLVKQGYDVTGAFMVNYDEPTPGGDSCWVPDYRDAIRVAAKLAIPLIKLDFTKEYKKMVLDYMFKEYEAGRTPNPDILCNKFVKFGVWLDKAREMRFEHLATGHYANMLVSSSRKRGSSHVSVDSRLRGNDNFIYHLNTAEDDNKDQTYFLHQLNQEQLKHVLFPIGSYTKIEVRKLAKKFNLPTAEKEESMGICFIGEVPMKEFLETKIKHKPGKIILPDGTILDEHEGLAFYTIGQRHLGIKSHQSAKSDSSKPLYVVAKRSETNELVVGYEDDPLLYKKEIEVTEVSWVGGQPPAFPLECEVRLRHRQPLQKCQITKHELGVRVKFKESQRAVTPGQFAVFYKKGECLGGGAVF